MNKIARTAALAAVLLAFALSPSQGSATTLRTHAVQFSNDCPSCIAVNVGNKPISITVETIQTDSACPGCSLSSRTCTDVAPDSECVVGGGCLGNYRAYCKITFPGSRKAVTATLSPLDETDGQMFIAPAQ